MTLSRRSTLAPTRWWGTFSLGLPIGDPAKKGPAYGAAPNSIAVDQTGGIAYVALYNANAVAVFNLNNGGSLLGMIPVGYAPSSVALDAADNALLVANDKGIGTTGFAVAPAPDQDRRELVCYRARRGQLQHPPGSWHGKHRSYPHFFHTGNIDAASVHEQSLGPGRKHLCRLGRVEKNAKPLAIPLRLGAPSKIKHVFVIIRENRTYDQILGDVAGANGQASLAVFGDNPTFGSVTPNAHALVQRFPLFDNFYDPSRQSADGTQLDRSGHGALLRRHSVA